MTAKRTAVSSGIPIENLIREIRGHKVILDSDIAALYGVTTKRLKEQVKRNAERFPNDFAFTLTRQEVANLRPQFATLSWGDPRRTHPFGETHGLVW